VLHAPCISSSLIWSPKKYLVRSAIHEAPHDEVTCKHLSLPSP
jgi:hypothetical protein